MGDKRRKQHYVWEHYLRAWAQDDRLWCSRRGTVFKSNTENVAQERDFYRLREITDADLEWIETMFIRDMPPHLQKSARGWYRMYLEPHRLRRDYEASGRKNPTVERELELLLNDAEEELHSRVEGRSVPLLAALREADHTVLTDDRKFGALSFFLGLQYFRTRKMMTRTLAALRSLEPPLNAEGSWGLLRTILATNVSWGIFAGRDRLSATFLTPAPGQAFVTGDQPVTNMATRWTPPASPPKEFVLYYPISPSRALFLDFEFTRRACDHRTLTEGQTDLLNHIMVEQSESQVFAADEATLRRALTEVGSS